MSSWVALNVEPDEAVEEEVDDTKELQIEEALKLYHGALKLHSQGPEHYPQAAEAYQALLNSEIFKYPESISDFKRGAFDDVQDELATESIAEFNVNDSTSSLFQTLYLSYKNHGKFVLDSVQDSIQTAPQTPESEQETQRKLTEASRKALGSFGDALERDDSDLNLWRQSARLSSSLNSYRLSRYCLESVLADDDNRLELRSEQLGLEEIFAEQRLRSTLQSLFDKLSASQIPAQRPKKALLKYLKQHEDPYPNLPALPADLRCLNPTKGPLALHALRREINPAESTWESVGKALLQTLDDEDHDSLAAVPTRSIGIILPAINSQDPTTPTHNAEDTEMAIDNEGHKGCNEVADVMLEATESNGKPEENLLQPTKEPSERGEEQSSIDQSAEKQLMESLERQSTQPQDQQAEQDGTHAEEVDTNSIVHVRKRSSASAANEEPEGGRMKSRRTRARESNADTLPPEEVAFDQDKYYEDRLEVFVNADDWMFSTVDSLFSKIGIDVLGSVEDLREKCSANDSSDTPQDIETRLFRDLRGLMKTWDDEKSRLMQQKDDLSPLKDIRGTSKSGLAVFLEHSRKDLKQILQSLGDPSVTLINNATMSELSAAVIDQEVLKLKCMDFFAKVFNSDSEDPVTLIEAIEPILEPSSIEYAEMPTESDMNHPTSHLAEMAAFLDRGDATLRLFLWRRLQEAYQAIDYPPKVVSCYLRSIEVIMAELEAAKHGEETSQHRQVALLGWLKALDGIVAKAILLILEDSEQAFDCFDMEHLQTSISAIARLVRLLHSFILYEDSVRVGQISGRDFRGSLAKSLENMKEKMRELYVRCWILQYTLFMEAIAQNKELFNDPLEDRIHFLRSVHNALGVRSMCRYSQKKFLKLLKSELFGLETKGDYEFDVCQILLDLHGIKFSAFDGTVDHGCPPEKLDRPTAIMMIDFVLQQANKMNMKDLFKSELKTTIEKMQQAIGPAKASSQTPQLTFNRRLVNVYLKAPINPSNLLRAVQGITELSTTIVPTENAKIASKGWFFLLGHAALTKFRSQKRLSPGPTSELDDAIGFFRQDLDHGTDRWETWYRLAQTYDSKLDEDITWTADKINNNRSDLAALQRNAIHCYAMAVSTAMRTAEPTAETREAMSDLYSDFGIRLYSSSREPLSMGVFSVVDFPRHYSSEVSQQMYKGTPFKEMSAYSTWNFASNLLKRAAVDKSKRWINLLKRAAVDKSKRWMTHYTLGKCLWKMFTSDDSLRTTPKKVEVKEVINAILDAIAALPQRRDSRSDPIFEPHFKLFSFVHKLVRRGNMTPTEGSKILLATPWARKIDPPENMEGWNTYILEVLRKYKSADKSNWHHRMGVKAAHIIYDDQQNATAAIAAKQELSQIFTKTLTIQVWRPEFERPGRHFVYTTRYVYFFVGLLDQLDDRASLDQLLRRVRKKQGDFFNHTKLWEDICLTYAKIIRRAAKINEGHEESVFKPIGWEEFSTKTARLESLPQLGPESQAILELLRDVLELKKLNNNLMKITMFEDLIADLYARLYEINTPHLVEQPTEENKEKMKVDHVLTLGDGLPETSTAPTFIPVSDNPAPRGRTKGIARRDIQKRADTIVNTKLAPRAVASKIIAAGETEPPATPQGVGHTAAGPSSASRGSAKQISVTGDDSVEQRDEHGSADETELSDNEDTKLGDEGTSALFPHVTDAEEAGTGDEGADEGDGEDDEGGHENEGEEGEGDRDEDEDMQDDGTKLEEEHKEKREIHTPDQSANDTEIEHVADKRDTGKQDAMDITSSES
ncbi:hypothetical protein DTO012A8_8824 [Penicillium roqueforti]|nr:hypothetical protein DTO012A8_8824 [Penicillium roqueforti]